jgi:hypothetical protein
MRCLAEWRCSQNCDSFRIAFPPVGHDQRGRRHSSRSGDDFRFVVEFRKEQKLCSSLDEQQRDGIQFTGKAHFCSF